LGVAPNPKNPNPQSPIPINFIYFSNKKLN